MSLKIKVLIITVATISLAAGFWLSTVQQDNIERDAQLAKETALAEARKRYSPIQGAILSPPRKIVVPELIQGNGEVFKTDHVIGQWSMLFFGFTHCPDICPITMGVLAQAKKDAHNINHMFPQVIFVSVDPERDKVEMMADYVQYFDKEFIGVTGDKDLIKALTLQLSVVYMRMANTDESSENYTIDHSSAILLINPEGKLAAFFNPPHDAKTILKDFQTVVNLRKVHSNQLEEK